MAQPIPQHEFPTEGGRCKHCGAISPGNGLSCTPHINANQPEPRARIAAVDDFDALYAALQGLRKGEVADG